MPRPTETVLKREGVIDARVIQEAIAQRKVRPFYFDNFTPELIERFCADIPGLKASLADPARKAYLETYLTRMMPDVREEILIRYAHNGDDERAAIRRGARIASEVLSGRQTGENRPAIPFVTRIHRTTRWMEKLKKMALASTSDLEWLLDSDDVPQSALEPANGVNEP